MTVSQRADIYANRIAAQYKSYFSKRTKGSAETIRARDDAWIEKIRLIAFMSYMCGAIDPMHEEIRDLEHKLGFTPE